MALPLQDKCTDELLHWSDEAPFETAADFSNTPAIELMHERSPRFGNSDELLTLIQGNDDDNEYVQGLIASSIVAGVFFLLWAFLIIYLNCYNKGSNPSLLSGQALQVSPPPQAPKYPHVETENDSEEEEEVETKTQKSATKQKKKNHHHHHYGKLNHKKKEMHKDPTLDKNLTKEQVKDYVHQYRKYKHAFGDWQTQTQMVRRRLKMMRITVIVGCCIIITAALLFAVQGSEYLVASIESGQDVLSQGADLTQGGINSVETFLFKRAIAAGSRQELMERLNVYCPLVQDTVCDDILTATNCKYDDLPYSLLVRDVIDYVAILQESLLHDILDFRNDLAGLLTLIQNWQQTLDGFHWALYVAIACCLSLALLCVYIMMGVILAWRDKFPIAFSCLRSAVVLPLFIVLVFLSWIFSAVFMIGSIALADFCIDSPDKAVLALVNRYDEGQLSSIVLNFVPYFASGKEKRNNAYFVVVICYRFPFSSINPLFLFCVSV
jgi:hypothetical protein